ncbi:MAG: DUF937 domain-containing protein, partial [Bacteroidota bacterium]|nr:DUF937 domain-containing protein [Bacteroidota bacterium]
MSNNLIDFFQSTIAPQLATQTSGMLGESSAGTSAAVNTIFSSILGSMVRMGSTDQGANQLLSFIQSGSLGEEVLKTVQTGLEDPTALSSLTSSGSDILNFLFGNKITGVIDHVASANGLKTSSASTLLKIIASIAISLVSGVIKNKGLDVGGLKALLSEHISSIDSILPQDLKGLVSMNPEAKASSGKLEIPEEVVPENNGTTLSKLLPWIVLLIAALGLFYFLQKGSDAAPQGAPKENTDSIRQQRILDSMDQQQMMDSLNSQRLMNPDSVTEADSLR